MKRILIFAALLVVVTVAQPARTAEAVSLAGQWRFALDPQNTGTNDGWFARSLPDQIQLPGILEAQGYGDEISIHTPWVLSLYDHFWYLRADYAAYTNAGNVKVPFLSQPPRHYLGPAWYQRDIDIPTNWTAQRVVLFLERPHWQTTVWLDDKELGSDVSLCTPHEYELGTVAPGSHKLTIRVDNRMILPYRLDAHSVSDSLDDAWNGIVGKIELRRTSPVWIDEVRIFPNIQANSVLIKVKIGNETGLAGSGTISFGSTTESPGQILTRNPISTHSEQIAWGTSSTNFELSLPLGKDVETWDEFHPVEQCLHLDLSGDQVHDERLVNYGLRDFHAETNEFILNGHPLYFRGTHFGGDFALTGYPPTDVESWKKIFLTCKNYGLNHMRFHSWCPPEAAFEAADELGFYLQVECGMWNSFTPGGEMEKQLYSETERIIRDFGNHPSLMLISASNEAAGRWMQVLPAWVKHFRAEDPRHLYTPDTGWSLIDSPEQPVNGGADYLAIGRVGSGRIRGDHGWFGSDYGDAIAGVQVPIIGHEVGQWVAYPDFDVINKLTGFMHPGNYEIFRDSAAAHGLLAHNKEFAWASGRFQVACYKEEVEANLRTPGLSGFQLLDLHDYTGQGTALVGVLDPLWESKGYTSPDEFKKFCNSTVPLARLTRRTFTTADAFSVPVEVAHYGNAPLEVTTAAWQIVDAASAVVAEGHFAVTNIPVGKNFALGNISADLSKLAAPAQYRLRVVIGQASHVPEGRLGVLPPFINEWNFWLYPAQISSAVPAGVTVASSWSDAAKALANGGKVLFTPRNADLDWNSPPLARTPVFWNALMGPTWSRMLGLWCDTNSPALAEFPTEPNCDWQWTELLNNTRAINLDKLPKDLEPVVSAIDDWNRNYKLGLIFEASVGSGKLLVCAADLTDSSNPVAQQLRRSLLDYMGGDHFQPKATLSPADFESLHFDSRIMHELGAQATGDGHRANELVDGDPNTFWSSADARGNGPKPPHDIVVSFPQSVAMTGLLLMPRQNQREHQGDIREFTVSISDDATNWQQIAIGQLASTFDEQTIPFNSTVTTKFVKLTGLSGFGNDHAAALAEVAVLYAGPALNRDDSGNVQYKNVRTASPDIDAGDGSTRPPKK